MNDLDRLIDMDPARTDTVAVKDIVVHAWPIDYSGQYVGMRAGILAVHTPSGVSFVCESERSQDANRERATEMVARMVAVHHGERRGDGALCDFGEVRS